MGILLGFDLGTEGARVGAFSDDGVALGSVPRPYRTSFPRSGWAEQDPHDWWRAVVEATRTLLATDACRAAGPVVAISCATTASTVAVLDADGRALRPAILWMDSRASEQAGRTAELADRHPILAWSGGSDAAEWLLPKAVWLKENEPATYARAARIVEAVDYLTNRLTGRWVGSQMNAVCKYNYDPLTASFPQELYEELGIADLRDKVPDHIAPVGSVAGPLTSYAAEELGITAGAPVAVGGIDAHVSLLSCGGSSDGLVSIVSGTSSAVIAEIDEPCQSNEIWGPYPQALRTTKWLVEGGQVTSGSVLKWAGENIMGVAREDLAALIAGAAAVEPGSHGLRALDSFMGNRTPYRDARLRGAVVGLTLGTTREELYRAAVEAVACGTRGVIDSFQRAGVSCERLIFSGGIERNSLWQQVSVDVLGCEAEIVDGDNLTLRACAVIAATGAGIVRDLDEGAAIFTPRTRTLTPDPIRSNLYRQTYDDYVGLMAALTPTMHDIVDQLDRHRPTDHPPVNRKGTVVSTTPSSPVAIARIIDHTLLKPEATQADVAALIAEADSLGTYSICVSPSMLPLTLPAGSQLKIAVVTGFPSGKHTSAVKAAEAAQAVASGADEIDMVIDVGAAKSHDYEAVQSDIAAVRTAAPKPTVLKVIIESAALTDDEIVAVCQAAMSADADFVKTSTGFHPTGGATENAVALMAATVGGRLGVKASGGVRTLDDARRMIAAGATRLGVSGTRAMLEAADAGDGTY